MGGELLFSFTGIDPVQLLAIWAIVVFAAVIRAFTGFGFALAAVPVFSLFMQPSQAVVLSVLLALTVSLLTLRTYWGKCPIKPMLPMVGFSVIGTAIGALILARVATDAFQLAIGVCVIVVSLVLTLYKPAKHRVGLVATAVTGLASGLMNGALAIPGPPVIIYAVATSRPPSRPARS